MGARPLGDGMRRVLRGVLFIEERDKHAFKVPKGVRLVIVTPELRGYLMLEGIFRVPALVLALSPDTSIVITDIKKILELLGEGD